MAATVRRGLPARSVAQTDGSAGRAAAWRDVLLPFLASRLLFLLITLTAGLWSAALHLPHIALSAHDGLPTDRWYRWDALWYMRVATDGYRTSAYANHHLNLAFFPLYPALLHLWLAIWPWSRVLAEMLLANLCSIAAAAYLYRLVRLDYGRAWAARVAWLLAFFPTSLFLTTGYSEGLFLLCLVACFYHLRLEHWWTAALWGTFGALTRPLGVIVVVPFLICWYQAYGTRRHPAQRRRRTPEQAAEAGVIPTAWRVLGHALQEARSRMPSGSGYSAIALQRFSPVWKGAYSPTGNGRQSAGSPRMRSPAIARGGVLLLPRRQSGRSRAALAAVAAIPAGLLAYMGYLWARVGNPLAFSASQRSWHRTWAWPWQALGAALTRPLAHLPHPGPDELHAGLDTLWAVVFLWLTVRAVRQLPAIYSSFLWLFWLVVLSTPALLDDAPDPLISLPRFLLTAFPLLIFLGGSRRRALIAGAISLPLLILNTAIFVSGGWVA